MPSCLCAQAFAPVLSWDACGSLLLWRALFNCQPPPPEAAISNPPWCLDIIACFSTVWLWACVTNYFTVLYNPSVQCELHGNRLGLLTLHPSFFLVRVLHMCVDMCLVCVCVVCGRVGGACRARRRMLGILLYPLHSFEDSLVLLSVFHWIWR